MKRTSTLGAAAGVAAILAGCSFVHTRAVAKDCDTDADCQVTVNVTPNTGTGPACTIADPGDVFVPKNRKPEIVWSVQNSGGGQFKFAPGKGAIALKSGSWDTTIFRDNGSNHGGAEYRVKDNNNKKKGKPSDPPFSYPYKITVVKQDGSAGCTLDPTILNDGCEGCP